MDMIIFIYISVLLVVFVLGRWSVTGWQKPELDTFGRSVSPEGTPQQLSRKPVRRPAPTEPFFAAGHRSAKPKQQRLGRGQKARPICVDMADEDRALIYSLMRQGQQKYAKRVFKQVTNLKDPALSIQFGQLIFR